MKTRVRRGGNDRDRVSGNMVWGEFVHLTARPVGGVPDPHLHAHCFVFNTTWDEAESRWKAGQFRELKRDAPFFEAVFHSRLARRMEELGLPVERTRKGWEIAGVSHAAIRGFSRRTEQIEDTARQRGISDPEAKGELGAMTREGKQAGLSLEELRQVWRERLSPDDAAAVRRLGESVGEQRIGPDREAVEAAVTLAAGHCFERNSVAAERRVLREAMRRAYGPGTPETVAAALAGQGFIHADRGGQRMVTTREVLAEEGRMLAFAREGRGACRPLGDTGHRVVREWLSDGQQRAVRHVLDRATG